MNEFSLENLSHDIYMHYCTQVISCSRRLASREFHEEMDSLGKIITADQGLLYFAGKITEFTDRKIFPGNSKFNH